MSKFLKVTTHPERRMIGKNMRMSLHQNKTRDLWSSFMPVRGQVDSINPDFFSIQVYDGDIVFSPHVEFTKWACVEVNQNAQIPNGMEELIIPAGDYAVFLHEGPAHEFPKTLNIVMEWMQKESKKFDNRPQFEVLPPDYPGPTSPDAYEEVWIPIKPA